MKTTHRVSQIAIRLRFRRSTKYAARFRPHHRKPTCCILFSMLVSARTAWPRSLRALHALIAHRCAFAQGALLGQKSASDFWLHRRRRSSGWRFCREVIRSNGHEGQRTSKRTDRVAFSVAFRPPLSTTGGGATAPGFDPLVGKATARDGECRTREFGTEFCHQVTGGCCHLAGRSRPV